MKAKIRAYFPEPVFMIDKSFNEAPEVEVDLSPEKLADYAEISMKFTAMQNHLKELYMKTPEPEDRS